MSAQEQVNSVLALHAKAFGDMGELAKKFLMPEPPSEDERKSLDYSRKLAESLAAVSVVISVMNISGTLVGSGNYSSISAISDLAFTLNTNIFWTKYASYLSPILNTAINAFSDSHQMMLEPHQPLWDKLQYHNRNVWLELLPAIVLCLKGPAEMRKVSLEMKKSFEPFLR